MKIKIGTVYVILLHFFIALILVKPGLINRVYLKLGLQKPNEIDTADHYTRTLTYHSIIDQSVPSGAVIFLGDSHFERLCVSAIIDKSVNYGIGGDTTDGVLKRLPVYKSLNRANAVIISVGHNDLWQRSNEEIIRNYKLIIEALPYNIPILFSSVLPVDERADVKFTGMNIRISSLNSSLQKLCNDFSNCYFIDSGQNLIDETGNLAAGYHNGKGAHLNANGNSIWISYLKDILHNDIDVFYNKQSHKGS
ncbi:MAG: hypothetical protein HZC48_10835 [Nitrospirae bacterium]|nr:hypothetical protein [Nitrospirota bacterium]